MKKQNISIDKFNLKSNAYIWNQKHLHNEIINSSKKIDSIFNLKCRFSVREVKVKHF